MPNVQFIVETNSMLVKSLETSLTKAGYGIIHTSTSYGEIKAGFERADAIVLYMDGYVLANERNYRILANSLLEMAKPVFAIGNIDDIENISQIIPQHMIRQQFTRPINVKDMLGVIAQELDLQSKMSTMGTLDKRKILVVDDSGEMLRTVKSWLQTKYEVALASSGAMAIKYLVLNRPDLILLDYEMPVLDGKQVFEMIKSEREYSDIPVIFLTSKGDKDAVMQVMGLHPDGYLLKSMSQKEIIRHIDDFFMKKKFHGVF